MVLKIVARIDRTCLLGAAHLVAAMIWHLMAPRSSRVLVVGAAASTMAAVCT